MTTSPPRRILVVDDEPDTCANLADILTDLGYQVDRIISEGADAVCSKPFDVDTLLNTVRQLAESSEDQA